MKVLRMKDVSSKCGISPSMVWAKLNPKNRRYDAAFPQPFALGKRAVGWLESEVDTWIEQRAAKRGAPRSHAAIISNGKAR